MLNLETGQEVLYKNEKWNVLYVWRNSENVVVRITLGKLKFTDIDGAGTTWGLKRVDASPEEISECKHELTAKEYAEKLREAFWTAARELDPCEEMASCDGMKCKECPFSRERREAVGYSGGCDALTWYYPDLAVKLMDEWQAEKSKPKGKTYLQDFMEKMPNARVTEEDGLPYICVKNVYGVEAGSANNCAEAHCEKCWNEAMPEEDNGKG